MGYVPHTEHDIRTMLSAIGIPSVDRLFDCIPERIRLKRPLDLPPPLAELELRRHMAHLAAKNRSTAQLRSFLGAGAYDHFVPAIVDALASRGEFLTAYTPYQAEASQGTLQHIFEFQTMMCELTGLDVANASHYDGATALWEAAAMAIDHTGRRKIVVSQLLHPHYRAVLRSMLQHLDVQILEIAHAQGLTPTSMLRDICAGAACVIVQNPNFFGILEDLPAVAEAAHAGGALAVACVNPVALGILRSPGECGFDLACGEAQPLGIPLSFGGPWAGFLAARKEFLRAMPGRIVGETVDTDGRRAFVLTLQTREQHIRREKASSNICTNQALMALRATVTLSALGPGGLARMAELCVQRAHLLAEKVPGRPVYKAPFFHEFAVEFQKPVHEINRRLIEKGFLGGYDLHRDYHDHRNTMLLCCTEKNSPEDIEAFAAALREVAR
ncbi:MAG: aminomethyl-transferring glycine dehydrogenase subunit GcvPA [Planctomycetes bacterium]|nr:aminomethyl-transferring glycine dehydrogenase subunit GcvPA [Planctomycetota bacterium]